MDWMQIISLVLNLVFGGGLVVTLYTLRAQKKKANAEADTVEIDNAQKLVNMWENLAEKKAAADAEQITILNGKITEFQGTADMLRKIADKLTKALNKAKECPSAEMCPVLKEANKQQDEKK